MNHAPGQMNIKNDGGPAFPIPETLSHGTHVGMSLRDWFAGMAMQGMMAGVAANYSPPDFDGICQDAYVIADTMLESREDA